MNFYEILWNFWQFCDRWPMAAADQSATWWLLTKYMCGSQHSQFTIWSSMWIFLLIEIVIESVDWMKLEIGWYHQICLKKSQVFTSCLNYWCAPNPMLLPLGFSLILYMIHHSRPTPCHPRDLQNFHPNQMAPDLCFLCRTWNEIHIWFIMYNI